MKLRVLSINIAGLQYSWFEGRRDMLIREIENLQPDIVFLQESTVIPSRKYDQSYDILKGIGLSTSAFTPYGNEREFESERLGGIGILSRYPFKFVQNRKLPPSITDPYGARSGLGAIIEMNEREIFLATTHLSYRKDEKELRLRQATEFLSFVSMYGVRDVIIGGDFNAKDDEESISFIRERYEDVGIDGPTFKDRRIDYLFSSHSLKAVSGKVVLKANGLLWPSDHNGIMADFVI